MTRFDVIGRQAHVLGNLASGDPGAALRSEFSPQTLSPDEARLVSDAMGMNDTWMGALLDGITNPLILIGGLLHFRWPVTKLKHIVEAPKHLTKQYERTFLPPLIQQLRSPYGIFADKPKLLDHISDVSNQRMKVVSDYAEQMIDAGRKFEKATGNQLTERDVRMYALWADGLADAKSFKLKQTKEEMWRGLQSPVDFEAFNRQWTKHHEEFGNTLKGLNDKMYARGLLEDSGTRDEVVRAMSKKYGTMTRRKIDAMLERGGLDIDDRIRTTLKASPRWGKMRKQLDALGEVEIGQYQEKYWPHMLPDDVARNEGDMLEFIASVKGDSQQFTLRQNSVLDKQAPGNLLVKEGKMLPDPRDLKDPSIRGVMRQDVVRNMELMQAGQIPMGKGKEYIPYSLGFHRTLDRYVNGMANMYAFNVRGNGRKLLEMAGEMATKGDQRAFMLRDTILPLAAGRKDTARAQAALYWAGVRDRLVNPNDGWLNRPDVKKYLGGVGTWLKKKVNRESGPFQLASIEDATVDWMYTGALGGNFGSIALNAMQPLMTTIPLLGADGARGYGAAVRGMKKYFNTRIGGMGHVEALKKTFPEFTEAGFGSSYKFREAIDSLDTTFKKTMDMEEPALKAGARKGYDKAKKFLMSGFENVELMNQLSAFQGAIIKGRREGMKGAELMNAARWVTDQTQFVPSVVNSPVILQRLKGWPGGRLLSMFGQFMMRAPEFLLGTATRAGAAQAMREGTAFMGRNFGTVGRAMLLSGMTYEAAKAAGVSVDRGLITGFLPESMEGAPGYPIPLPPFLNVGLSAVSDVFAGELKNSLYSAPLLVPGGTGAARLAGYMPGGEMVGRVLGRKYADWDNQQPDGRVPLYSESERGPSLVGFFTPQQLMAKGLGLPWQGDIAKETQAMKWLLGNLDRIQGYKSKWMEAWSNNDFRRMRMYDGKFQKAYPQLAGGIKNIVRPQDLRMIEMKRMIPRLEKVMDQAPAEMRPMLAHAMATGVLSGGEDMLGIDPRMLGTKTRGQRNAFRRYRMDRSAKTRTSNFLASMGRQKNTRSNDFGMQFSGYGLGGPNVPRNVSLPDAGFA
jgi:hypothetical protein